MGNSPSRWIAMVTTVVVMMLGTGTFGVGRICTSMYLSCQKNTLWNIVGFAKIPLCSGGLFFCVPCLDDQSTADLCNKSFKACEGQCMVRGTDDKCYSAEGEVDCLP